MIKVQVLLALVLAASPLALLSAQDGVPSEPAAPQLSEGEIDSLSKLLAEWRALEDRGGRGERQARALEKATEEFRQAVEKTREAHKDEDILTMVDSWSLVFASVAAAGKSGRPPGTGRVREELVSQDVRGREVGYNYGIYLPSNYDGRQSWPLIIALHDEGSDGRKYLNEVWMKADKEVRDKFVILAPTVGNLTVARRKSDQLRIEWFDKYHVFGISRCLVEILNKYNIDTNRMYLDGCGLGGRTAVELAMALPKFFAAVACRSADPLRVSFLPNLKGQSAVLFADRMDGIFSTADGKEVRKQIQHLAEVHALALEFRDYEPLPDRNRLRQAMGTQQVDPIHESTAEIADFFLKNTRNPYPSALHFATYDIRRFPRASWIVLQKADADPMAGTSAIMEAKVDRASNTFEITTTNVEAFRIYLNDRLVDMNRAIKVKVNGQDLLEQKVDRSLEYLLDFNKANASDPTMVMTGEIMVNIPVPEEPGNEDKGEGQKDTGGSEGEKK